MKRIVVLILALTTCFSLLCTVESAATDDVIVPFAYDKREVRSSFSEPIKASGDTIYVTVVGVVSSVFKSATITSVSVSFSNSLYNAAVSNNGNNADIVVLDKVIHDTIARYVVTISYTGNISIRQIG